MKVSFKSTGILSSRIPQPDPLPTADPKTLAKVVKDASEALLSLTDRLNALALTAALVDCFAASLGSRNEMDYCLNRLYELLNAAGEQVRQIQKLLHVPAPAEAMVDSKPRLFHD